VEVIRSPIEETGIDECKAMPDGINALLQIEAGTALFIDQAQLDRIGR
jgi:hypothetical protein